MAKKQGKTRVFFGCLVTDCFSLSSSHGHLSSSYTIDTEIKAKRNNMISEFITVRITKAKVKFGVRYLCGHECERSSVQLISIQKRKRKNIFGELISLQFPCQRYLVGCKCVIRPCFLSFVMFFFFSCVSLFLFIFIFIVIFTFHSVVSLSCILAWCDKKPDQITEYLKFRF